MKGKDIDIEKAYFYGRIEAQIETFAHSHEISWAELTGWLAGLLLSASGRQVLGSSDHLSSLRGATPERNQTSRKVEVARGSRRGTQASRRRTGWEKFDTPEKRSREVRRRFRIAAAKRKLKANAATA